MLEDGSFGRAAVPSGASTGAHEAVEKRDGDKSRWGGKGVEQGGRRGQRRDRRRGRRAAMPRTRPRSTRAMIELDGTDNKARLGANAILGVSLAVAKAAADARGLPLYRYVGGRRRRRAAGADDEHPQRRRACRQSDRLPGIHGHAGRRAELRRGGALRRRDLPHAEEGAARRRACHRGRRRRRLRARTSPRRAPRSTSSCKAVEQAGYKPGDDVAARARLRGDRILQGRRLRDGQARAGRSRPTRWSTISPNSPATIRSPRSRTAWPRTNGGLEAADRAARRPRPAGRRRSVRHQRRSGSPTASRDGIANSILVKVNQIGTLTETLEAVAPGAARRLHRGDVAPLGRDRGHDHRRPRGRAPIAGRSRPAAWPAPTGSPSTTSCSGSRRSLARSARYAGRAVFARTSRLSCRDE